MIQLYKDNKAVGWTLLEIHSSKLRYKCRTDPVSMCDSLKSSSPYHWIKVSLFRGVFLPAPQPPQLFRISYKAEVWSVAAEQQELIVYFPTVQVSQKVIFDTTSVPLRFWAVKQNWVFYLDPLNKAVLFLFFEMHNHFKQKIPLIFLPAEVRLQKKKISSSMYEKHSGKCQVTWKNRYAE